MNEIYIIAKIGDQILIINRNDLPYVGKERALEVMSIEVDLRNQKIEPILELEKYLKFDAWEEIISEQERNTLMQILNTKFSDADILKKIMLPLAEKIIK